MGTFYTKCIIENHIKRIKSVSIPKILVDTGSEYTWIPGETLHKIGVIREKKDLVFGLSKERLEFSRRKPTRVILQSQVQRW